MENKIAKIIFGTGVAVIVIGIVGSFIMANQNPIVTVTEGVYYDHTSESYNWGMALTGIFASTIFGILLIGFSEVVNLLNENLKYSKMILGAQKTYEKLTNPDADFFVLLDGDYLVGKDIPVGSYIISGDAVALIKDAWGNIQQKQELNTNGFQCNLEKKQIVHLDGATRFKMIR